MTDAHGLTRANLAKRTVVTLQRGSWDSPDVLLVDGDWGPVVVKDFSPRRRLIAMPLLAVVSSLLRERM